MSSRARWPQHFVWPLRESSTQLITNSSRERVTGAFMCAGAVRRAVRATTDCQTVRQRIRCACTIWRGIATKCLQCSFPRSRPWRAAKSCLRKRSFAALADSPPGRAISRVPGGVGRELSRSSSPGKGPGQNTFVAQSYENTAFRRVLFNFPSVPIASMF
jgi:hypothetical protein